MSSMHRIDRKRRIREFQKEQCGVAKMEVTFQIPIEGIAKTGMAVSATELLTFGVGFYPKPGETGLIDPVFRGGFSIRPRGGSFDPMGTMGYMGFANCPHFEYSDDGFCIGAICHVGVVNMAADGVDIPFKGYVNLSFLGLASRAPLEGGNLYQYTGPASVALMERDPQDD